MDNTFYFNPEWMEILKVLTEEGRNRVISGIVIYQTTGNIPENLLKSPSFLFMKMEVDRRNRRLAMAKEKRMQKKAQESVKAEPQGTEPQGTESEHPSKDNSAGSSPKIVEQHEPVKNQVPIARSTVCSPEKKAAIATQVYSLQRHSSSS